MKKSTLIIRTIAATALVAFVGVSASAAEIESSIARGGKLYDKWFAVIGAAKPADTHSAWPASNTKKKGNVTWRCKSCHGWDQLGKDGAYASGSYKTGIVGVSSYKGKDNAAVIAIINDDTHRMAGMMEAQDLTDLANFVTKGQVDMSMYIANKAPKGGNAAKGEVYYNTICAGCHGKDGQLPKEMKPMGALMSNPWEILHKILNGHPGEPMPALRALDRQIPVDIMTHLTTLPKK